jgi:hypothetical protein
MSVEPRDVLRRAAVLPRQEPDIKSVIRRGRTLKTRRRFYAAGAVLLILVTVSVASMALSRVNHGNVPPGSHSRLINRQPLPSNSVIYRRRKPFGFSIRYPATWYRAPKSLTPHLASPHELVSIGTRPLKYRPTNCAHLPKSALQELSPTDAFISIEEEPGGQGFPARPSDLREGAKPTKLECVPARAPLKVYWILFRDSHQGFYGLVAIGRRASATVKEQAWKALNSFSARPLPSVK